MGLYNRSAMAAISDICKLANFQTQTGQSTKKGLEKNCENEINIDDWSVYFDLGYAN